MASRTVRIAFFQCHEFEVVVSYKVMRNVRFRMKPEEGRVVEMSVPYTFTDSRVRELLEELYPRLVKLSAKMDKIESNLLGRPTKEVYTAWFERLKILAPLVEREMGLNVNRYTLRYMTSRWGSCRPDKGLISLNSALASLEEECTHYVLVHELSHIVHPDHSPAFWHHVERYFPDYRRVRAALKKIHLK